MVATKKMTFFIAWLVLWAGGLLAQEITVWGEAGDALITEESTHLTIENDRKALLRVSRKAIVFNKKGQRELPLVIRENNFVASKDVEAVFRNIDGSLRKKIKKKEFRTVQAFASYVLYSDVQYLAAEHPSSKFPYQLEFSYELELKSLFFWPGWRPQKDIPVQRSIYRLTVPEDYGFETHAIGLEVTPETMINNGQRQYEWAVENLAPRVVEPMMSPQHYQQKALLFRPNVFKLGASEGSLKSWSDIGNWYRNLLSPLEPLPSAYGRIGQNLLEGAASDREKVERIYAYLQNNTRYVAIQLGIGGWQPHSPKSVFANKYGDCKDLSNYMVEMLKVAGIEAYSALILTRDEGVIQEEFSDKNFNHCITMVPVSGDTLWLECTSDMHSAGDLPANIEGTQALVTFPDGGRLIRTPESRAEDNRWRSKIKGVLSPSGTMNSVGEIQVSGNQADWFRGRLIGLKRERRRDWLRDICGGNMPKFKLKNHQEENVEENYNLPVRLSYEGSSTNVANRSGKRLFINPNILNRNNRRSIDADEERQFPVSYEYAYEDVDSVEIRLPLGYRLEAAPKPQEIDAGFAYYKTDISVAGRTLKYVRVYRINQRDIPVEKFDEYVAFRKAVSRNDQDKIVFKK